MKKRTLFTALLLPVALLFTSITVLTSCTETPPPPAIKVFNPIFIEPISQDKALVADVYNHELLEINTSTNKIENSYPVSTTGGAMAVSGKHLYMSSYFAEYSADGWPINGTEKGRIIVFDLEKMKELTVINDVFNSSLGMCTMCVDSYQFIWILCDKELARLDPGTHAIDMRIPLPAGYSTLYASSMEITTDREHLKIILSNQIEYKLFSYDIEKKSFNAGSSLKGISPYGFYGMGNSEDNTLLVCDAINFNGVRGKVIEYSFAGDSLHHFDVGIAPSAVIPAPAGSRNRFTVINQGTFTTSNASISVVNQDNTVTNDAFRMNNNRPLGDVAQSASLINDKWFICISNSKKIEVTDVNFKSITTIIRK